VAVVIRLQRAGARNRPFYRVVIADSRRARDGAFIEKVGYYDPLPDPDVISIDHARVSEWIGKGARPSEAVRHLIRRSEKRAAAGEPAAPPASAQPEPVDASGVEADAGAAAAEDAAPQA
jgi:small subunit ribosomal protein S16